jgi:hypothetical protein
MIRWVLIFSALLNSCETLRVQTPEKSRTLIVDTVKTKNDFGSDDTQFEEFVDPIVNQRYTSRLQIIPAREVIREVIHEVAHDVVRTVYGDPGTVIYSVPDSMIISHCYRIRVRIQKGTGTPNSTGLNRPVSGSIRTSSRMSVDLIDPSPGTFKIVGINGSEQVIENDHYTEWNFSVTPQKSGRKSLLLRINIVTPEGPKELVFEDEIFIKNKILVHARSFWKEHWKWVFSTLLIPIFLYFWGKRKEKKISPFLNPDRKF